MMADFNKAYSHTMKAEGGYVNDQDDLGGETYKGIARKYHSKWEGWSYIDTLKTLENFPKSIERKENIQDLVRNFYEVNFWDKINGDKIESQKIAESIFDFAVNGGVRTSCKIAQLTIGAKADGVIGEKTLLEINKTDEDLFIAQFALAKIARYAKLVEKRKENRKYFYGWVRRTLEGL